MNVKSQSELDIGGRKTCCYFCYYCHHLDGVVGGRGLRDWGEEHCGHPDIDVGEEHYNVI